MIKPPFTMSKFMSEEALHKTAHFYYKDACEDLESYIELIDKVVDVLAEEVSFSRILKHDPDISSDTTECIIAWAKAKVQRHS